MPRNRRNKYGARKVVVDGITFDSAKEAGRYRELKILQEAGHIRDLTLQPSYPFPVRYVGSKRPITYKADFSYRDNCKGEDVVEDVKGIETQIFKIKRALMKHFHGIDIKIT